MTAECLKRVLSGLSPFQPLSCRHGIVDSVISPKQDSFLEYEGGISQIFRSAPAPNLFRKERAAA